MAKINALVLRAAGTNCNEETEHAFSLVGINPVSVHINELIKNPRLLLDFQIQQMLYAPLMKQSLRIN